MRRGAQSYIRCILCSVIVCKPVRSEKVLERRSKLSEKYDVKLGPNRPCVDVHFEREHLGGAVINR
jgi:hypothetical protein